MTEEAARPAPTPSLSNGVLNLLADEAKGRLAAADLIGHPGERGRAREVALGDYLRHIVPPGFGVSNGFVIDASGGQSRQQDIVIYRLDYHPVFRIGGVNYFPVEAVAAVVEVKSTLDGRSLDDALSNSASVKSLDRTANGRNYRVVGGIGGDNAGPINRLTHEHQILSLIVAASAGGSISTLCEHVLRHIGGLERSKWPNYIAISGVATIGYNQEGPEHIRCDPMSATGLRVQTPEMPANVEPLVDVANDLLSFLRVTPLVDFRPNHYLDASFTGQHVSFLPGTDAGPTTD